MPGVIAHRKFLLKDLGDQRGSPHPRVQAMRHGATVQEVRQLFPLGAAQLRGPSAAMSLQQSFIPIFIPSANPSVNAGAIHLQSLGDLTGGPLLDAEHDGL